MPRCGCRVGRRRIPPCPRCRPRPAPRPRLAWVSQIVHRRPWECRGSATSAVTSTRSLWRSSAASAGLGELVGTSNRERDINMKISTSNIMMFTRHSSYFHLSCSMRFTYCHTRKQHILIHCVISAQSAGNMISK